MKLVDRLYVSLDAMYMLLYHLYIDSVNDTLCFSGYCVHDTVCVYIDTMYMILYCMYI